MNSETLKALQESIEIWKRRTEGEIIPFGKDYCPLCQIFNNVSNTLCPEVSCKGCPVFEATGKQYCYDTPYEEIILLQETEEDYGEAMKEELYFLQSLLP